MFSQCGSSGSPSRSASEWTGASKLRRSSAPASASRQSVLEPRVLDDHVGELLHDRAVQLGIGREVDGRAAVVRLQVDDADAVERAQTLQKRPVPVRLGVELELELRLDLEPPIRRGAGRDDEADGTLLAPERLAEAELVLPEREIEERALERPAPVILPGVVLRIAAPKLELVEMARDVLEAPCPREHQIGRHVVVIVGAVGDVLALAGRAVALEHDRRRNARPARRRLRLAPLERVAVDLDLEPGHGVPERHTASI